MIRFAVLGPFDIPVKDNVRAVNFDNISEVEAKAAQQAKKLLKIDLYKAIGLYIFCLKPSGGSRVLPYYVGQACKQLLFTRALNNQDKRGTYNDIYQDSGYKRAKPVIYFLPLLTPSGRLARIGTNKKLLDRAEYALIGLGRAVNSDLWNVKHRVEMDSFEIDGVFNSKRKAGSAKLLKNVFKV